MAELPCDSDGMCMVCKAIPSDAEVLLCNSCSSPWHMNCLKPPMTSVPAGDWFCPDCEPSSLPAQQLAATPTKSISTPNDDVVSQIRAIRSDPKLTEEEKARKCQDVMSKTGKVVNNDAAGTPGRKKHKMLEMFDETLNCIFCMQLADRPVTTPCGHNFCLKCFQKWIGQGKKACGKCRAPIPAKMASQPRINATLVIAIRLAKSAANPCSNGPPKPYHYIQNQDRPDKCFTTERAKKAGKANASSGKIFVTVPPDHFGPITAENDPVRGQGVLVGETWEDRMECRQWGAHLPHVAGIAGQSDYGAQSVALSGGYEDDEDHGEWFLYTGSGGRDLSGNKRTNDKQSFDQTFDKSNLALRVSCKKGYPVRVVRSHKEKRSSYAPENGVRYDGIYRIEKCWRKIGIQGFKVCRYLFVRCDNEPAPWTSDERGDMPRPLPKISEMKSATDLTERKYEPSWDWKEEEVWGWTASPPTSRKVEDRVNGHRHGSRKSLSIGQRLLKEFGCDLCKKVLKLPLSTPCGHNFCKSCLVTAFAGQGDIRERTGVGGRSLRTQKVVKRCPSCQGDISDFLSNPQVNRQMEDIIESLKNSAEADSDAEINGGNEEEDSRDENCSKGSSVPIEMEESHQPRSDENKEIAGDLSTHFTKPENKDDKSAVARHAHINGNSDPIVDPLKEKQLLNLCKRYPEYSEELLRSMLMDQEGDMHELESVLKALRKQQKASLKKHGESGSSRNGNDKDSRERNPDNPDEEDENAEGKGEKPGKGKMAQPPEIVIVEDAPRTESKARESKRKRKERESEIDKVQEPISKRSCQGRTCKSVSFSNPLQAQSDSDFQ